jgi:hypothetical protein
MPIRINLLAEEQAAEEARRRDPVKRGIYAGVGLILLTIAWIGLTQLKVNAAKSELSDLEARLKKVDETSKTVKLDQSLIGETEQKLKSLDRYSSNRFFWGTLMDALQNVTVENIRLVDIKAVQNYIPGETNKLFGTNILVAYTPQPSAWKFWASASGNVPVTTLVSNQFKTLTNKPPFTTNLLPYAVKITPTSTNETMRQITAQTDFVTVGYQQEQITIEIQGRDYSATPGVAIDEFVRRLTSVPYFKERLEKGGQGFRLAERPTQPRSDANDLAHPNALFIPFTMECHFEPRMLTNE